MQAESFENQLSPHCKSFNTCACNATPVPEEICQDSTADNFANIFKPCLNIPVTN